MISQFLEDNGLYVVSITSCNYFFFSLFISDRNYNRSVLRFVIIFMSLKKILNWNLAQSNGVTSMVICEISLTRVGLEISWIYNFISSKNIRFVIIFFMFRIFFLLSKIDYIWNLELMNFFQTEIFQDAFFFFFFFQFFLCENFVFF